MIISIEYIIWLKSELLRINKMKLEEIKFTLNGSLLNINKKDIKDFKYTGLNNTDFITGNFSLEKLYLNKENK